MKNNYLFLIGFLLSVLSGVCFAEGLFIVAMATFFISVGFVSKGLGED